MTSWIDTHCHLNLLDEAEIINAQRKGVGGFVIPGLTGVEENVIRLADSHIGVVFAPGVHPLFIDKAEDSVFETIESVLDQHEQCAGLGETGLDYYNGKEDRDRQIHFFVRHLELAEKYSAPVIIHLRKGFEDFQSVISDFKDNTYIMHMYSGSKEFAESLFANHENLYFSFGGPHLRKHSKKNDKLLKAIPRERILIETDSPDLPPEGFEKPNTPSNLPYIAENIAEKLKVDVEEFSLLTLNNTQRAFSWKKVFQG